MTDDEIWSALVGWVRDISLPIPVIRTHQSGQAPADPYIAINFLGASPVRDHEQAHKYSEEGAPDSDDEFDPVVVRMPVETDWRFSIHSYGENASAPLRKIEGASKVPQIMELLGEDFGFVPGPVLVLPEFVQNEWRDCAQMNLSLRGILADAFKVDVIGAIPFTINGTAGEAGEAG